MAAGGRRVRDPQQFLAAWKRRRSFDVARPRPDHVDLHRGALRPSASFGLRQGWADRAQQRSLIPDINMDTHESHAFDDDTKFLLVTIAILVVGFAGAYYAGSAKLQHRDAYASEVAVAQASASKCVADRIRSDRIERGWAATNGDLATFARDCEEGLATSHEKQRMTEALVKQGAVLQRPTTP